MKLIIACLLAVGVPDSRCSSVAERNISVTEPKKHCLANQELLDKMKDLLQTYLGETEAVDILPETTNRGRRETYTHWGRASCSKGSTLVYSVITCKTLMDGMTETGNKASLQFMVLASGYAGSNYHYHSSSYMGGPANMLCLPKEPIYADYTAGKNDASMIYGTEYYDSRTSPNFKRLHSHDVPCAVCQTRGESNVIMIPGRNECYPGWKVKYWGYLMSGGYSQTASEYICVDRDAEATTGGKERKFGRLLYLTESRCGSLPCPPYIDYYELTCVVCAN